MFELVGAPFTRTAEEQHITTRVLDLEPAQPIVRVGERCEERDVAGRELRGQGVWIGNMDVGIPAGNPFIDVPRAVWSRIDANVLEYDHRASALNDTEEDVVRLGP